MGHGERGYAEWEPDILTIFIWLKSIPMDPIHQYINS